MLVHSTVRVIETMSIVLTNVWKVDNYPNGLPIYRLVSVEALDGSVFVFQSTEDIVIAVEEHENWPSYFM